VLALRVPAGFLAAAQFPVTIDPFISTFVPGGSPTADEFAPDVSFDRGYRRYLVVWETGFSSTDHDVWAQVHDRAGSVEPGMGAFVDMTTEYWARPRVGENENSNAFTVVAAVGDPNASPPRRVVKGRNRLAPPPLTQYAPYAVSAGTADDAEPEFGGDACECYPSFHLVVWVRTVAPGNRDIIARHLIVDGRPNGPELVLGGSPEDEFHIAVSASVGARPFSAQRWNVVWTRADSTRPGNLDLWGAQIYWDGTVVRPAFPIDDSPEVDDHAAVSSVVDPGGTNRRWLVVWERQGPGDTDLHARVLAGASPVTEVNLVALEGGQREGLAQMRPRVDTDGYRFVVTYAEERTPGGPDLDVFASTFDLRLDSVLGLSEGHVPLGASARIESVPRIANALNAEFLGFRYGVVWESGAGADRNVEAALYDGLSPGGGYTLVPETGCDNHFLEPTGIPALGQTISVRMFGRRFRPFFLLGVQIPPAPVCPLACRLGVDPVSAWVVPTDNNATLVVGIPGEGALVGLRVAVQGVDLSLQPNICPTGYELYTSPTLLVTIR
jgi:hypothetical protein